MTPRSIILEEYRARRRKPFVWGTDDCLCFAAACAMRIIGRDPIAHLRGRYASEVSAKRLMVENGWQGMGDVARSLFAEISPANAQAGDWALITNPDGTEGLGVVMDAHVAARMQDGMGQVWLSQATRAFRVAA